MSHNSIEGSPAPDENGQLPLPFKLAGTYAKTAKAIGINIERIIREDGLPSVVFVTLTIGDTKEDGTFEQCFSHKEGSKRFNSLATNFLGDVFRRWVVVTERHKNGAIHFHMVASLKSGADVRTGFNHAAVRGGEYSSAGEPLRALWALMREKLPEYGFGRAQSTPIEKTGEAIAAYVSKYVEKNLFNRLPEDHRKKLVRYGGFNGTHCRACDIGWANPKAAKWRDNAAEIAGIAEIKHSEAAQILGCKWAWKLTKVMGAERVEWSHWLAHFMQREIANRSAELFARPLTPWEVRALRFDLEEEEMWHEVG